MKNRLQGVSIPGLSQEVFDKVLDAFKSKPIKDSDTLIAIGRRAGREEVVEFLRQFVSDSYVSGDQKDIDIQTQEYSPTQRLFKDIRPNRTSDV